ncbi:hypothetical protein BZG36_04443 [Bifiguratus adelaidae]|uniref:tRNA-binding domain-containing protein n=1 Tax=Bifiguratus adelaidae TaxID=1938954 RepID=A0A261XVJ4_9FUNG|nr:hypothetical protein BZG36_04443 [Bifiguratus adelaidae]
MQPILYVMPLVALVMIIVNASEMDQLYMIKIHSPTSNLQVRPGDQLRVQYTLQPRYYQHVDFGQLLKLDLLFYSAPVKGEKKLVAIVHRNCPVDQQDFDYKTYTNLWTVPNNTQTGRYAVAFEEQFRTRGGVWEGVEDVIVLNALVGGATVSKDVVEAQVEVNGEWIKGSNTVAKVMAGQESQQLLGTTPEQQQQILNDHLANTTYLAAQQLTLADIMVFGELTSVIKAIAPKQYPHVVRWYDLLQNTLVATKEELKSVIPIVPFDLDTEVDLPQVAPADKKAKTEEAKAERPVADGKAPKPTKDANAAEGKKEKKKKEKKEPAPAAPAAPEQPEVTRLDIRVGYIRNCKKHESADTLYVEEIDLGDGEGVYRTVVSGLVKHVPIEEMQNRWVLCLTNLKPANMRGVKSEAMVLCSTAPDGSKVEILGFTDASHLRPGMRVTFDGMEGEAEKVLNPKKKYWETVQPDLRTSAERVAMYKDLPFRIKDTAGQSVGVVSQTIAGGSIK